jgi:Protein of unknown function (DUF2927)
MKAAAIVALALATTMVAAASEHHETNGRRSSERKAFTDAEIVEGFFKTAFGAELHLAGAMNRIRKFDGPVRVFVENRARPTAAPRSQQSSPISARASSISISPWPIPRGRPM